jgi:PTS system nitrogen regulatory IIA component
MQKQKYLSPKEVAELLGLPLVTIQRWEHQGKIPFKIINKEKHYKKTEILDWAKSHDFATKPLSEPELTKVDEYLVEAIERGGIYRSIQGDDIFTVLKNSVLSLPYLDGQYKEMILNELLNREELASTGIGNGIAIPHTRNRIDLGLRMSHVSILFLENEIDFNSIDGLPVIILFIIFSLNTKEHLRILSKISHLLHTSTFLSLLKENPTDKALIELINELEHETK